MCVFLTNVYITDRAHLFSRPKAEVQRACTQDHPVRGWQPGPESWTLDLTQGPSTPAATRPQGHSLGVPPALAPALPAAGNVPCPSLGWERLPRQSQQPLLWRWAWSLCTPAANFQATTGSGGIIAWETFPHLTADTQALSQVTRRPGHRTVDMFPGTRVFREENKEEQAASDH